MGNLVSQLDTPFSVLAVKDVLIFRMLHDIFPNDSFSFLISNFIFLIASSSTANSICWTVMRLDSPVVILGELLNRPQLVREKLELLILHI